MSGKINSRYIFIFFQSIIDKKSYILRNSKFLSMKSNKPSITKQKIVFYGKEECLFRFTCSKFIMIYHDITKMPLCLYSLPHFGYFLLSSFLIFFQLSVDCLSFLMGLVKLWTVLGRLLTNQLVLSSGLMTGLYILCLRLNFCLLVNIFLSARVLYLSSQLLYGAVKSLRCY